MARAHADFAFMNGIITHQEDDGNKVGQPAPACLVDLTAMDGWEDVIEQANNNDFGKWLMAGNHRIRSINVLVKLKGGLLQTILEAYFDLRRRLHPDTPPMSSILCVAPQRY